MGNSAFSRRIHWQNLKKIRDLSGKAFFTRLCSFFEQRSVSHVFKGPQMKANTLSTEAPTDFGGNFAAKGRELWKTAE
ncbi:hypothetical protein C4K27_5786 [Pseudomonas chlororaphis subsp. chlororaphis]|nr:hypothetical protein C4K27_5786 [Pseudomonas chlororaphis subsp. chlororaphis]